jgi:hypothetical protein
MPAGTPSRKYRAYTVTVTQNLELGQEIITTRYEDGEVHTVTRGLLHGPWPPKVYKIITYDGSHECLPSIAEATWRSSGTFGELHPWIIHSHYPSYVEKLRVNECGWIADKESLRPALIKALRVWHTKLTQDLADAEDALAAAIFNKPI